jgi:WD40 repeat protein
LNSIVLSPNIIEHGLFASLSDKGKLILAKINIKNNDKINFEIKKVCPFENKNHFSKGDTKKIDWSLDGSMIISVDHQLIQDKKIIHARLIFLDDLENTQPLIGHVSSPLIAKFSKCNYIYDNEIFQLLMTCDRASNIKLWKVSNSTKKCSILFTNDDFSDSIIRDIIFSNDGKFIFIVSSFGSISIISFDELQIVNISDNNKYK